MRKRHVCPKCEHHKILLIAEVPDTGEFATEIRPLMIASIITGQGWLGGDKKARAGALSAAVCKHCGFTELYVVAPGSIPVDGESVREVTGPEPTGAYR